MEMCAEHDEHDEFEDDEIEGVGEDCKLKR
jgi:hypothetical protein